MLREYDRPLKLTPKERLLFLAMADGEEHTIKELCAISECQTADTIYRRLRDLRNKIRPYGEDILCRIRNKKSYYVRVKLLTTENALSPDYPFK